MKTKTKHPVTKIAEQIIDHGVQESDCIVGWFNIANLNYSLDVVTGTHINQPNTKLWSVDQYNLWCRK